MTESAGRGGPVFLLVGALLGGILGVGMGSLAALHPKALGGMVPWMTVGGIGGLLGSILAIWAAVGAQLRSNAEKDSAAGIAFGLGLVAGTLGGVVGGAMDGGPWDLLFGGLWGLLLGGGVGLAVLIVTRFLERVLLALGGPAGIVALAGGGAACVGAGYYQPSPGGDAEFLLGFLRFFAGALAAFLAVLLTHRCADLPTRGSSAALVLALLLSAGLASYYLTQSPLVASIGHSGRVTGAGLSPDGLLVLIGSEGKVGDTTREEARLVDTSGSIRRTIPGLYSDLNFTADGKQALGARGDTAVLFDLETGKVERETRVTIPIERFNLKQGGIPMRGTSDQTIRKVVPIERERVLIGAGSGRELGSDVALWEPAADGPFTFLRYDAHKDGLTALAVTRDGSRAASGSADGTILLWDIEPAGGMRPGKTIAAPSDILALALSSDGKRLAATLGGIGVRDFMIHLWDAASGEKVQTLTGHGQRVPGLVFLPDGRLLSGSEDGTVRVWELPSGTEQRRICVHARVAGLQLDVAGKQFLVVPEVGRLRLYRLP